MYLLFKHCSQIRFSESEKQHTNQSVTSSTSPLVPLISLDTFHSNVMASTTEQTKIHCIDKSTIHRDNLPIAIAVAVAMEGQQDVKRGKKHKKDGLANAGIPPASTKDAKTDRASQNGTVLPPKKQPSPRSISFLPGSLEPSPALKFIMSILWGVTILLALGVIGILVL